MGVITIHTANLGEALEFTADTEGWYRLRVWDDKGNLKNAGYVWAKAGERTTMPWVGPMPATDAVLQGSLERGWWVQSSLESFEVAPAQPEPDPEPEPDPPPPPPPPPPPDPDPPPPPPPPPDPEPATWPGPTNTGVPAGVELQQISGGTITTPGTVIDAKRITGTLVIAAKDVLVRRCRFVGNGSPYAIHVRSGNVTVEDSEIDGNWTTAAIAFDNWAMRRCNIHGVPADGCKLGNNVTLEDSWIHDFDTLPGEHADGAQVQNGVRNLVVRHNSISCAGTSSLGNAALFIAPDLGPSTDGPVLIEQNLLHGGNYTLYCVDGGNGRYLISNITIRNNRFRRGARYGPRNVNVTVEWADNVWDDTGEALRA